MSMSETTDLKVIHTRKKLFCYLAAICNLVQEFNGLVSIKGQRKLALFTFRELTV